jgi:hypothetical protein
MQERRHVRTLLVEVSHEIKGECLGAVPVLFAALRVRILRELGVGELRELDRKRSRIVVELEYARRAVARPTVADVESVEVVEVLFDPRSVAVWGANFGQTEVCKDLPVNQVG